MSQVNVPALPNGINGQIDMMKSHMKVAENGRRVHTDASKVIRSILPAHSRLLGGVDIRELRDLVKDRR